MPHSDYYCTINPIAYLFKLSFDAFTTPSVDGCDHNGRGLKNKSESVAYKLPRTLPRTPAMVKVIELLATRVEHAVDGQLAVVTERNKSAQDLRRMRNG